MYDEMLPTIVQTGDNDYIMLCILLGLESGVALINVKRVFN